MSTPATQFDISNSDSAQHSIKANPILDTTPSVPCATPEADSSSEKATAILEAAPDGGLQAWMVAIGASCIFFSALGFANSFGVFQEYYMTHQLRDKTPDEVAWIGSLSAFLQLSAGCFGGPLFDRYGAWVIRPLSILYVFSVMMLSLCHEYWHFMLVHGVLVGTLAGLLMFPAMAAVSQYFDKKRATALGVAVSGSSIGGIVIPIAFSKMLNGTSLGFGWSVRIVGFVLLPLLAFCCVVIKSRLPPRKSTFWIPSAFKNATFNLLTVSLFFLFLGMFAPLFFIPTYAVSRGMDATLASYMLAILNAASTFGRIIPGVLADKFGRLNILALGGIITGIIVFCLNQVETTAGLVLYSIAFGFSSGTIISGGSAAFAAIPKDARDIGTYMGMGMAVASIAALIGPPVNGALINRYGGFQEGAFFSGAMCLFGGFLTFMSKLATVEGILGKR
ncbi:MFS general substrate transporter [Melanomma pulvis-pyrius CBS 109.77]|uniref:MFS general substrate transporter n=1 Tax=Melanomma pulvis-pyrius CBS 109.77 TaxID=1314802 RepID=A0A6A6XLE1_9PLEO|nr:MFS general substrate transporter [Melanomma pulvis-pyrius CBS 109.77]